MPRHRRSTAPEPLFSPATLRVDLPAAVEPRRDAADPDSSGDRATLGDTAERVANAVERASRAEAVESVRGALGYDDTADGAPASVAFESVAPGELEPHGRGRTTRRLVSRLASDGGPEWGVATDGRYWRLHGGTPDEERYHEVDVTARAAAGPEALEPFVALFSPEAFAGAADGTGGGASGAADALLAADGDRRRAVRERLRARTVTAVEEASESDRLGPAAALVARLSFDLFVADRTGRSALVGADELVAARRALRDAAAAAGETEDALARTHAETFRRWTRAAARADPMDAFGLPEPLPILSADELARVADAVRLAALLAAVPVEGAVVEADYRTVDARLLGAVYEQLVARGAFTAESDPSVAGRRKDEGSFYTPDPVVSYVVARTVRPLAAAAHRDAEAAGRDSRSDPDSDRTFEERVRERRVLDPAMGTGNFLVAAVGCLTDAAREAARDDDAPVVPRATRRARIVSDCVYGVDRDRRATDVAKLTLWAETLGEGLDRTERPSLSDRLVTGDSLLGSASELFPDAVAAAGDRVEFDAVVGNPPWKGTAGRADISARLSEDVRSSIREAFESAEGTQPNLAAAFLERGRRLAPGGRLGFVVPDAVLVRLGAESLRRYLLRDGGLTHLLRVGSVFSDANEGAAIVVGADEGRDPILTWHGDAEEFAAAAATDSFEYRRLRRSVAEGERYARLQLLRDDGADEILRELEGLDAVSARASVGRGEEFGKRDDRIADEPGEGRVPIVSGAAVRPYGIRPDAVRYVEADAVAKDVYDPPKLVARQTGSFLVAAADEAGRTNLKSVYDLHVDHDDPKAALHHLLGAVNSTVCNYYHYVRRNAYPAQFPQQNQRNYETLPVWSGETDSELVALVESRVELARTRLALDSDVRSHVAFEEADVPLAAFDPTPADDPLLSAHRGTTPGLRIDSLSVRADGSDAVLSVSYGREGGGATPPREALRFSDAAADVRTVLDAWIPAVSGASLADRRATGLRRVGRSSRTTPAARLGSLRVPDPSKYAETMARYLAVRDRHSSLTDRARRLDARIDRRVAELVGLTDDQLAAVRATMADVDGWSSLRP
ncbi:Eco57I restriction-modification methylase domain-containing protein [Halopelagius longus]|uniref:site-specific DNA-methyltransferase (adenine-specific) n=1 Tax=Halopelagius longus TaxID=1236180 RepID=A0A1H1GM63_9EURY|nr:N-6 DNA methylase [Halopelagius longus]RDI69657.1 type I restriction endonuclease subunit M [Halopelagius longus]SDR14314.1 N-6 DNA Methylase [Halopelagius longus]